MGIRKVVSKNYDPKGERFLIASRFPTPLLACAFFIPRATVTDYCCSKGNVEDKILAPKLPKNYKKCERCGHPVDGPYCQGCALLRKELEEDLVTHFQDFQNTHELSDDSTNIVNAPREPFVVKQDHGSFVDKIIWDLNKALDSPHLHTFSSNQRHCFHCKDVLGDGESCQRCTCTRCGSGLSKGLCYICGNNQNSLNDSLSSSENSSQSPSHINHHCCYECGDALDGIFYEFIKSSVENLVPNPSESEGENECDVPTGFTTFSNVLFDAEYDFDFSDDQSFSDEDLSKKIYSNPIFDEEIIPMKIDSHSFNAESDLIESMPNHDSSIIISSKIDSLFDEFAGELTLLKSIPPGVNETDCHPEEEPHFTKRLLYDNSSPRPPEEFVSENSNADIESFSPSPIPIKDSDSHMEEIGLSFNPDDPMLSSIEEDDDDSKRDIPILEELLDNSSLSLPKIESFHFDIPLSYRPPAKPPDGNTGILNIKMMGDISDQKVPIPILMITHVSSQEKSPDLLPH
nr:hypothetical protein [Tanacetum cinerariifolium]